MQQINDYDFKGNPLQTQQQLLNNATLTDVDWNGSPVLSTEVFTSAVTYDALNRPVTQTDPGSNVQAFTYDKGRLLKTVTLNNDEYVSDIHYDAKGQRQAIWYGNGTKTSYTYDEFTFRLRRLLTVNLSTNAQLKDLNYYYEPVGNITTIRDDAQQTLFFSNTVVSPTQTFTYDALYRLITATGRELKGTAAFGSGDNWNDAPWMGQPQPGNGSAVQTYTQQYTYDEVGNILSLQHIAGTGSYKRTYAIDTAGNKLLSTTVGSNTYSYTHDTRGNMLTMPHLQAMGWNALNELYTITQGTTIAHYQYSGGQRVRKYVNKGTIKEERIYFGSYELYRKFDSTSSLIIERTTMHVSDDTGRIAMLEVRTQGTDASLAELTRYIYSNHLQSANLELDDTGAVISYEEYHPYGTTSYQAMNASINAVAKRYRYTGKERDEESGLYYHGARYYIPWLCRWSTVDPLESKRAGLSPYDYCSNNPINRADPDGRKDGDIQKTPYPKEKHKEGDVWLFENEKNRSEATAMNGTDNIEIPAGSKILFVNTGKTGEKDTKWVLFGFETKEGESFAWNDKDKWYTTKSGKEYDNPWYDDILNAGIRTTSPAIEVFGIHDFGVIKGIKDEYAKYDGGVASFALHMLKEGIKGTVADISHGGNRRSQALLGLWMSANISYMPTTVGASGALRWLGEKATTSEGFLFGSVGFKLPFDLKVGLYASENTLKYGTFKWSTIAPEFLSKNEWFGRRMLQIAPEFQPKLGTWSEQMIPKGTYIRIGFVGPQTGLKFGSWLQLYAPKTVPFIKPF